MVASQQDLERLRKAVLKNELHHVKKIVEKFGRPILDREFQENGDQELYPDMFRYYLIHLAIQNRNLEMIKYLADNGVSPHVSYTKESNFNSRADQYLDVQNKDLIQWAYYCSANNEILTYLQEWKIKYKRRY